MNKQELHCRYFTTYSGIELPLKLLNELDDESLNKRITYFSGYFDDTGNLKILEKIVYGEVEFSHHYEYDNNNVIKKAILVEDEELPRTMVFDTHGQAVEA